MKSFKFDMNANVAILSGEEIGEIIARAEYATAENSYLIRYRAGDCRAVESWWGESALNAVD
jgi:hypothetical protein